MTRAANLGWAVKRLFLLLVTLVALYLIVLVRTDLPAGVLIICNRSMHCLPERRCACRQENRSSSEL